MKNNIIRKLLWFVPILLIIVLLAAFLYSLYYIDRLEEQIWERDKTIQELSFRSDLVDEFFDIKYDTIEQTISYSLKSTKANYVIMQQDSTELVFRIGDSLFSAKGIVKEFNDLIKHYNQLYDDYYKTVNDCNNEFNKNMHQIREMQSVLNLIEKKYNIQYEVKRDSTHSIIQLSNTEKIDSALMLLPYYKDRLKKVSDDTWTIEHY